MTNRQPAILTMVGGILVAAGSLLPWATVSSGFGSISLNGIEGDGKFTLAVGAALTLVGYLRFVGGGSKALLTLLLSIAALGLGLIEYANASKVLDAAGSEFARTSIGIGLYLILLGGAVALFGALRRGRDAAKPAPPAGGPPPPVPDHLATLSALAELRDRGAISDEEYEAKKASLLARV